MIRALVLALVVCLAAPEAEGRRSGVVVKFRKANPCPSTMKVKGPCPGWQVDHVVALRCGGTDTVGNLQWLTVAEHRIKTAREARVCRGGRRG